MAIRRDKVTYVLDATDKLDCDVVLCPDGISSVNLARRRPFLPTTLQFPLDYREFRWLTFFPLPPSSGECRNLAVRSASENDVVLEKKSQKFTLTNKAWAQLKQLAKNAAEDLEAVAPYLEKKNNPIVDRTPLLHLLLSCAARRYRVLVRNLCKLCGSEQSCPWDVKHSYGCVRFQKSKCVELALESLDSVDDVALAAVLRRNGMDAPGLAVPEIVRLDEPRLVARLVEGRCKFPVCDNLVEKYVTHLKRYYGLYGRLL